MAAAARGDAEAYREVFRRYGKRIFGFLMHLTGDRELAMDLTQETFLRAWSARGRFDPERRLQPWLFRIATNVQADASRSWLAKLARRTRSLFEPGAEGAPALADRLAGAAASRPDRLAEAGERSVLLHAELARLPEGPRRAIVLHDLEGLPAREIALILGHPIGTVLSWLKRGRATLRARLEVLGEDRS